MSVSAKKKKKNQTSLQTEHVCDINFILKFLYFQLAENTDEIIVGLTTTTTK